MSEQWIKKRVRLRVGTLGAALALGAFAVGCGDEASVTPTPDAATGDASTGADVVSTDAGGDDVVTPEDRPVGQDVVRPDVPSMDVPATDVPATDVPATDVPATDVPATDVPATDVPVGSIDVRVAHLSPGAPAVDFCLRAASATSWSGVAPTLNGLGGTAGLAYTQVTRYLSVPAGAYTVRIVAPGSANCDTALAGLADTTLPMLPAGARATVSAVGVLGDMGATAFRLNPTLEDAPAGMSELKVRFVHASPGTPAVDLGIPGAGTAFTALFSNVAFPNAAMSSFTSTTAISNASLAARVAGMDTQAGAYPLQINGVSIPLGATVTAFAVGRLGNTMTPLSALVCSDGQASMANANLTSCAVLTNPPPAINVRVAHLSPDAPAVDFCARPASATTWTGVTPTLRGLGLTAGLAYTQVTRYLSLPAGAYTVRLVAPGSTNCDSALGGLPDTTLPALSGGTFATVAAVGTLFADSNSANDFRLTPIVDDDTTAPMNARLRFVHASPGTPAVDVGIPGAGTAFTGVFNAVAFPSASDYVNAAPLTSASVAARVAGVATQAGGYPLQVDGVTLPAGARATIFAVGILNSDQVPLSALVCTEGAPMGDLTPCTLLPARVFVRVGHLAPDAPAVDFCLRATSASNFSGVTPTLRSLGVSSGFSFPTMTRYLALPPGAYTARIVAPGSTNCDTALAGLPDVALPNLTAGTRATVAASGLLAGSGATAFGLRAFVDGNDRPALGRANLRFIHLSPGAPAVDVGLVSGGNFTAVFSNTVFGSLGAAPGMDPNGYFSTAPISGGVVQVRPTGSTTPVLTLSPFNLPAPVARGMSMTVFAIGTPTGSGNTRLSALACLDREPAAPGVSGPCVRVP
ncbi:MAG: DUF4397 domain-containing protein [Polyangiales bacterium]